MASQQRHFLSESYLKDVLCEDAVLEQNDEFSKFTKDFVELILSDVTTTAHLTGPGYDLLPRYHTLSDYGNRQLLLEPRALQPTVYLIHNKCCVLSDPSIEYKSGNPVLLYATPAQLYKPGLASSDGRVVLHLSCRTYSVIQREDFGIPLKQSVVVRHDSQHVPKFHLSSNKFRRYFTKDQGRQFLLYDPPAVPLDLRNIISADHQDDSDTVSPWYESQKACVGSVRLVPALRRDHWPSETGTWATRARQWPDESVIKQAMDCEVLAVPEVKYRHTTPDQNRTVEEEMKQTDDMMWDNDFCIVENLLFSFLDKEAKKAFLLFEFLLSHSAGAYCLLKTSLLWCLEENGLNLGPETCSLEDKFWVLVNKLEEFLEKDHVPHYFMDKVNLLDSDENIKLDLLCAIASLHEDPRKVLDKATGITSLSNLLQDNTGKEIKSKISKMLNVNIRQSLLRVTEDNTRLLSTQLYQKLHDCSTVPLSIKHHQEVLFTLSDHKKMNLDRVLVQMLVDFIHSSLGNMYLTHGLQLFFKKEKQVFFESSKRQFSLVSDQNLSFNAIRSVFILLKQGNFQQVVDTLEPVLKRLLEEREIEKPEISSKSLPKTACDTLREMDLLVVKSERQTLPAAMSKNLSLAHNQLLGCTSQPVSVLDQVVLCACLLAEAYCGLRCPDAACRTLQSAEDFCLKDELDVNEKRGCVYLNLVAEGYLSAGSTEQGRYLLTRSLAIMPNPRNPGRWRLLSVRTRRAREIVLGSVGVAVVSAVTAVTINFLMAKK